MRTFTVLSVLSVVAAGSVAQGEPDWMLDPSSYRAVVQPQPDRIDLGNGLIRRVFCLRPNAATVGFDNLVTRASLLRGVKPEAVVVLDGTSFDVGGLTGQPNYAYLDPAWIADLTADPGAFQYVDCSVGRAGERLPWKRVRHHAPGATWPPPGVSLRMDYRAPRSAPAHIQRVRVSVHYELYDGIPCLCKWITVHNDNSDSGRAVTLDRFTSELLAAVERASSVESGESRMGPPAMHVETDYAFVANRDASYWRRDPDYATQVSYRRLTPCLLEMTPQVGPDFEIRPGAAFESFRTWLVPFDSADRERQGLAVRRMYRTIAPWVTENPLMMHVRYADEKTVKAAIDQCAEVGFEMVILTFGSGFDIENESPDYLAKMKSYADYARARGIEIGGYSLLGSRRIKPDGDNCIDPKTGKPGGGCFGHCPSLTSAWGLNYIRKLRQFYERTGFRLLEHDGSYPGDLDAAERLPFQRGWKSSRWAQWRIITDYYKHCRGNGIYLNVPDWYYLTGSSKCGMGYRETNWSLPRPQQVIHTRQNIYDGTWDKTPSMGWMFVPLTQYHGGGAAATVEPLDEHLGHYERMLASNLAMGVQACYRGPRLYDTDRTRDAVKRWVTWFKKYRDILESDVIHGRRADGRDLDWMLHVNPHLDHRGLLVVFNPLDEAVEHTLRVNLYYTGLTDTARIREREGDAVLHRLARDYTVAVRVRVPARGMSWYVVEAPK